MKVVILEEAGGYLLLGRGDGFAVVEKRVNHLYNCHDKKRLGIDANDLSRIPEIVDEGDWMDEETAREALREAISRWKDLAEHMR